MATIPRQQKLATEGEVLIGGYRAFASQHTFSLSDDAESVDASLPNDRYRWMQSAGIKGGSVTMNGYYTDDYDLDQFISLWKRSRSADLKALWAEGNRLRIGEKVGAVLVRPGNVTTGGNVGALTDTTFSGAWVGEQVFATLQSPSFTANADILTSENDGDYVLEDIRVAGGDVYTSPVTIAGGNAGLVVGATIHELVGDDSTAPALDINLPAGSSWRLGSVPAAANGQVIRISHKGESHTLPTLRTGQLTGEIYQHIESLRWSDGFTIRPTDDFVVRTGATKITLTGSRRGANEDITMDSRNPNPWSGTASGTLGGLQMRLFRSVGGVREYLTEFMPADAHDLPEYPYTILGDGAAAIGLHFRLPDVSPSRYNFQIRYGFWLAPEGT